MNLRTDIKTLLILLQFLLQAIVIAQPLKPRFEHLTTNNGLTNNSVTQILLDKKGFLWISSRNGLSRYDGQVFKNYDYIPGDINSLSDNEINCVYEDSKGLFWIATQDGLNIFNPFTEKITQFTSNNLLSSNELTAISEDKFGNIWIGTRKGLNRFNTKTNEITIFKNNPSDKKSLSNNIVKSICTDDNGNLWIGTVKGLCRFDFKFNNFNAFLSDSLNPNSIVSNIINYIAEDRKGNLWVGTINGLSRVIQKDDGINFENYFFNDGTDNTKKLNRIRSFDDDSKGNLWIGTIGGGLVLFDPLTKKYSNYQYWQNDITSINDNEIFAVCIDNFDDVWIGSAKRGISKFSPTKTRFDLFKPESFAIKDVPVNDITSVFSDSENKLWLGTNGNGVLVYQLDENYYPYNLLFELKKNEKGGLSSNYITSILKDRDGNYWIGTLAGGLNRFNPVTKKIEVFKNNREDLHTLSNNYVNSIYEDSKGNIWVGTSAGGVNKFDKKNNCFTRYTYDPSKPKKNLNSPEVTSICEDNIGNLWIGTTTGGLNIFNRNTEEFTYHIYSSENKKEISSRKILCIYEDRKKRIWIGTYGGGLNLFLSDSFVHFGKKDGLASNIIYSITEDDTGNLWLATNKGISRFNPESKDVKNFDESDGLQGKEFNPRAIVKHPKSGVIYFGGTKGLNIYNHRSISSVLNTPAVFITDFKIFYKSVIPGKDSPIQKSISYANEINLSHDQGVISFSFAALDFTSPDKNQYAYMLQGFDRDWIFSGNVREVTYTNLTSGSYVFKVKASNSDGIWNEAGTEIKLIIHPPFWATWWFRGILIFGFLSIGPLIYYRRVNQLKKEKSIQIDFSKQLIQSQENERKRIASELHDSLGQDLLVIKNLALLNKNKDDQFEEISKTAGQALDEVRRISYNLHPYQLDRLGLTKAIGSMFVNIEGASGIKFNLVIEKIDGLFDTEKEINIYRIVQECVNNIIKHSGSTNAVVTIQKISNNLHIEIADNGKGFDFELMKSESKGFGLKNLINRVSFLGGEIEYASNTEYATITKIKIPIKNE